MSDRTTGIDPGQAHSSTSKGDRSAWSPSSWGFGLACGVGALAVIGVWSATRTAAQDWSVAGAWTRAVETSPGLTQAFERGHAHGDNLQPVSTAEAARPLVIGERLTVVTPDGGILTLRVCDPRSPSSTTAPDCLNALVSRAVPAANTPVAHRSL